MVSPEQFQDHLSCIVSLYGIKGIYDGSSISAQRTKGKESHCQLPGSLSFIPTFPTIINLRKDCNIVLCLLLSLLSTHEQI